MINREKLEELYEKATVETCGHGAFGEPCYYREIDHELLVEIILKECIEVAKEHDGAKLAGPGAVIANHIRDHFGIEDEE